MGMVERGFSRRQLLGWGALELSVLLAGCNKDSETNTPLVIKEREKVPEPGDLITDGNITYEIRTGKRYPLTKGLAVYARQTRAPDFGARIFKLAKQSIDRIPLGIIRPDLVILDQIGDAKSNRSIQGGGQKIVYASGFMNDLGETWQDVRTNEAFGEVRSSLEDSGWGEEDRLWYTYGAGEKIHGYDISSTMRDLWENVEIGSLLIKRFKEQFPLERFNLIGHSLGAFILFFAAEDHLDAINNIILLNSPTLGLPPDPIRDLASGILSRIYGDKAIRQLLDLWNDKKHQIHVAKLVAKMKKHSIGLYTFGTEGDFIVPPKSAILEGSRDEISGQKIERELKTSIKNNPLFVHRRLLLANEAPIQMGYLKKIIGDNRVLLETAQI